MEEKWYLEENLEETNILNNLVTTLFQYLFEYFFFFFFREMNFSSYSVIGFDIFVWFAPTMSFSHFFILFINHWMD
jgi:hypothetical protein